MRIFNKLFLSLTLALATLNANAIPAKPGIWKSISLADGTTVKAEMRGDEFVKFWQTAEGDRFMMKNGSFVKVSDEEIAQIARSYRATNLSVGEAAARRARSVNKAATLTGKKKGVVILVEFSDVSFSMENPKEYYNRFSNEVGFNNGRGKGSVSDYFKAQSNGVFELDFDVVGPVKLPQTQKYYGENNPDQGHADYKKYYEFVAGALGLANPLVKDWSEYDWYGDGYVDQVYFIYAGKGEADSGIDDTIWPHEFSLTGLGQWGYGGPIKYGNVTINTYACSNELNSKNAIAGIGTMCHEFSHCLGYPDLYDAEYTGRIYGMGSWDLMHQGSYNNNGYCPPNYTSWEKMQVGWITPIELKGDMLVSNMKSMTDYGDAYIVYNEGHPNEYYMLENRQKTGWDSGLSGEGLLILHVDYDKYYFGSSFRGPNTMTGTNDHARLTIFHADNKETNLDEEGDTYPFGNVNSLTNNSVPAAKVFNKNSDGTNFMNCNINQITQNADGTISFVYGNAMAADKSILLSESFNKCEGSGANDGNWMTMRTGTGAFTPDVEGWSCASMGGASHCAKFGSSASNATVTSPMINFTGSAVLTFRVAPYAKEGQMKLNLASDNSAISFSQTSFDLTEKEWTDCSVEITGAGAGSIIFRPDCRIYLDEILVKSTNTDGIITIHNDANSQTTLNNKSYSLTGQEVPAYYRGIVIRNGKKFIRK